MFLSGDDTMTFEFVINGRPTRVDVPANMPLLWVIRDVLNLRGTKYGCGVALCGACTVHVDGEATRSCVTPVSNVAGKTITTIEGLSSDRSHAVQRAWIELDIDDAMSGNICRCGTYQRIRRAIHRAAEIRNAALHQPAFQPMSKANGS